MDIGSRIKENYERSSEQYLTRRTPVVVRVDGKAFSSYTRNYDTPFDEDHMQAMTDVGIHIVDSIQGAAAVYTQSDELSILMIDYATLDTQAWFDYKKSKLDSVSASIVTAVYNDKLGKYTVFPACFDSRSFNVPRAEVSNYFLWRMKDWERNSLSMLCREYFSHSELEGKGTGDRHEMLHQEGVNWATYLEDQYKNGVWVFRGKYFLGEYPIVTSSKITACYEDISAALNPIIYCDEELGDENGEE